MPNHRVCTFRDLSRNGFAGDPEPVDGSHYEIRDPGPGTLPALPLPKQKSRLLVQVHCRSFGGGRAYQLAASACTS